MSLVAIVNLAERLLNQTHGQDQEPQSRSAPAGGARARKKSAQHEDEFTSSELDTRAGPTAEAAGLFHVTQFTPLSATADFLLRQMAAAPTNQEEPAAPSPSVAYSATVVPAPISNPASAAPATNGTAFISATPGAPSPATFAPATTSAPASGGAVGLATAALPAPPTNLNTQNQLQALKNALAVLGLPQVDLAQIDRIASLLLDLNPTAFTDIVHQLEALAIAPSPQTAASMTNATNGGGLYIQELVIRFSGVEAQRTIGGAGYGIYGRNAVGNFQVSAFNLKIQAVNLTLGNNTGQTVQVQVPRSTANSAPAGTGPSAAKAKAATR
jgi:hypothetical protein